MTGPSTKLRIFLGLWRVLWFLGLPFVLFYLWKRGRKDPDYFRNIRQRFGFHDAKDREHIWVHAVSIGELRSAVPIIREFLDRGENVVTTHFTPAGLREARKVFADDIDKGRFTPVWVPFDYKAAFRRFFAAFLPKLGLVMEVEFWPGMIFSSRDANVPLFLCNGQYPGPSFERDKSKFLSPANLVSGFAGVMVKSGIQADRFHQLGVKNIAITGEMRFDQPIPDSQVNAANDVLDHLAGRDVIGLTNMTAGEEDIVVRVVTGLIDDAKTLGGRPPLIVVVPRAPERFAPFAEVLEGQGINVARRSDAFTAALSPKETLDPATIDVIYGDSLGEMYFYQSLCDRVVIGGGFTPAGSHNIIEPISLGKPVYVGPEIWTIDFPAREAIAAGVCIQTTAEKLLETIRDPHPATDADIASFFKTFGGSVEKTISALNDWNAY